MEYVHRCVICDWQRSAASPTVTSPRCDNCGCALESVQVSDIVALDLLAEGFQLPERLQTAIVRAAAILSVAVLMVAAARTGYTEGGAAMAVTAVGVAGLFVVMTMTAQRA